MERECEHNIDHSDCNDWRLARAEQNVGADIGRILLMGEYYKA